MKIVLQLPEVKREKKERLSHCPYCKGEVFQRWGVVSRQIKDTKVRTIKVHRYKCTSCKKTFRSYPEGVCPAQQSERLMKLCVILWSLGLSYRGVVLILSAFKVCLSHMRGWRSVQREGKAVRQKLQWRSACVVGVDGAWVLGKGIMVAVDLGDGELLAIAEIDEKEKGAVTAWLKMLKQKHKIGAIVTDDLASYKEVRLPSTSWHKQVFSGIAKGNFKQEKPDAHTKSPRSEIIGCRAPRIREAGQAASSWTTNRLASQDCSSTPGHQVCQFHVRRWVGKTLKILEKELPPEWLHVIPKIRDLLNDLPLNGGKILYELWKELPGRTTKPDEKRTPLKRFRDLVLRLSKDWERYIEFYSDPGIP